MAYGLLQSGSQLKSEGMAGLKDVAAMEERRLQHNDNLKQAKKQSKTSGTVGGAVSGAMIGLQYGSTFGPWGALIGGVAGYILS